MAMKNALRNYCAATDLQTSTRSNVFLKTSGKVAFAHLEISNLAILKFETDSDDQKCGRSEKKIYTKFGWMPMGKKPMTELEKILYLIEDALSSEPHPSLIYAARYIVEFDRESVPDWVKLLSCGNPDKWEEVVDEVRRWKAAEEAENASVISNND
jgi:hypothetical protein